MGYDLETRPFKRSRNQLDNLDPPPQAKRSFLSSIINTIFSSKRKKSQDDESCTTKDPPQRKSVRLEPVLVTSPNPKHDITPPHPTEESVDSIEQLWSLDACYQYLIYMQQRSSSLD